MLTLTLLVVSLGPLNNSYNFKILIVLLNIN